MIHAYDYVDEFADALKKQLRSDAERHGEKWLEMPRYGQTSRIMDRYSDYEAAHYDRGQPMPWLKVAGLAMIAWVREQYPELSPNWKELDN